MTPAEIEALFSDGAGSYRFARWRRPVAPVVFGVDDATLALIKAAFQTAVAAAGHRMAETDPEQGANLFVFFVRGWSELAELPDLEGLVPGIGAQAARLAATGAERYRLFRFEPDGAIRAGFAFLSMSGALGRQPADELALTLAVQSLLLWSDRALAGRLPFIRGHDGAVLRPDVAALLRAAYDPVLPAVAADAGHALRLYARLPAQGH
jgi:hypothetical protein